MKFLQLFKVALHNRDNYSANSYSIFALDLAFHMQSDAFDGLMRNSCLVKLVLGHPVKGGPAKDVDY